MVRRQETVSGQSELTISDFLSGKDQQEVCEHYSALAQRALSVGDADLRRQTVADWQTVQAIRASLGESTVWNTETHRVTQELLGILGSSHTLLGKIYAGFTLVDVLEHTGVFPQYVGTLTEAVLTEPTSNGSVILTGALYSRYMTRIVRKYANDPQRSVRELEVFDRTLLGPIITPEEAQRRLAIQAVARTLSEVIKEDELGMRLPSAILAPEVETAAEARELIGIAIPDSIMYLREGRLVSNEKLLEAVRFGMPHDVTGQPVWRMPHLLAGIEVPVPKGKGKRSRLEYHPEKQLYYISLRALRRPAASVDWDGGVKLVHRDLLKREEILAHCSFDTLSLIGAVRIARELRGKLLVSPGEVANQVEGWLTFLTQPVAPAEGINHSILSVALAESQRIDGDKGWGVAEAAAHFRSQIFGLLLRDIMGRAYQLRSEEEIWDLYWTHIIQNELTPEDKLEMAYAALKNPRHQLWHYVPARSQRAVVETIYNGKPLSAGLQQLLIEKLPPHLVLRCETIRDIHVMPPLSEPV